MSFQPYPSYSRFVALAAAVLSGAVAALLLNNLLQQNTPPQLFTRSVGVLAALLATGAALYWALVATRLTYHINRNGVIIQWGWGQQRIPFTAIENITPGQTMAQTPAFKGLNLGGLRVGRGDLAGYGRLKFRTTAPLEQSLLVVTTHNESFVISPQAPEAFIKAWQARQELGPTQQWMLQVRRQWPLNIPVLNDPLTGWLVAAAGLLCLALLGYVSVQYPDLPGALPVHFDNLGRADRIASKSTLFILPTVGALVWAANGWLGAFVYHFEKLGAYFLWGSAVVMQICLWVAVLTITA